MAKQTHDAKLEAVIGEECHYTVVEFSTIGGLSVEEISVYIEYGIIQPSGDNSEEWIFSLADLQRLQKALRLQHDLEIDLTGVALAIELLEEIDNLQSKINQLQSKLLMFTRE